MNKNFPFLLVSLLLFISAAGFSQQRVGINTTTPKKTLDVNGHIQGDSLYIRHLKLGLIATPGFVLTTDGFGNGNWLAPAGGVSGSGTTNYSARWATAATLATGGIYDDGINIGVGVIPNQKFEIRGSGNTGSTLSMRITNSAANTLLTVADDGDVSIGTTSQGFKLFVNESGPGIPAIFSQNSFVGNIDGRGVQGMSINNPGWGIGGYFEGGYRGLEARGTGGSWGGNAYGLRTTSSGSAGVRMGVDAIATGTGTENYGLRGESEGANSNYGVWGKAPNGANDWAGYFIGDLYISGIISNPSDANLKTEIKDYDGALDKVKLLNVKTFTYRTDGDYARFNFAKGLQYGMVAQEVMEVFPTIVKEGQHIVPGKINDGKGGTSEQPQSLNILSVNYNALIPVLTQAIKEQQKIIETQGQIIKDLELRVGQLERK